jgi:hypothetical protein
MKYERLDKGCTAKVLFADNDRVLIHAVWPASAHDRRRGMVFGKDTHAHNIVEVSRDYFEQRYGAVL